jgi:hypothetical protein
METAHIGSDKGKEILHRLSQLSRDKSHHLSKWQEVAEYLQPERANFYGVRTKTQDDRVKIFDSTPEDALSILAAALHSFLTPSVHTWFNLALKSDEDKADQETREWIDEVKTRMMAKFNSDDTGFHSAVHEFYLDLPSFGTAGFFVDEIDGEIRFQCKPLDQITVSENYRGIIDTFYDEFEFSARQIEERWPKTIPQCVKDSLEKDKDRKFQIVHAVEPRKLKKLPKKGKVPTAKEMPIASYYILKHTGDILEESGFNEMPGMFPRWSKVSGEDYGRGIGQKSLPDIRVLNEMNRSMLIAGERQAAPPLFLPHDGWLGEVSTDGDATNYYRSSGNIKDKVFTLESSADINAMMSMIQQRQDAIRKMFLNDKLQMVGGPQMTATEVIATQNEKMRILGPVLGRLQSEFLAPLIFRVFRIMQRNNELPELPEALEGIDVKVEYVSPISRAQRQTEAEAFGQAMNYLAPVVQVNPQVLRNFDFDAIARDTGDLFGYPAKYLKPLDTVKKEDQAAQQAQKAQAEKQTAMEGVMLAKEAKGLQDEGPAA